MHTFATHLNVMTWLQVIIVNHKQEPVRLPIISHCNNYQHENTTFNFKQKENIFTEYYNLCSLFNGYMGLIHNTGSSEKIMDNSIFIHS